MAVEMQGGSSWRYPSRPDHSQHSTLRWFVAHDEDLVALESGDDGRLLLTVDVFRRDGDDITHVAKLRRNAWAFGDRELYEFTTAPSNLSLVEKATGKTIVRASAQGKEAALEKAELLTRSGVSVVIDEDVAIDGKISFADMSINMMGAAIVIRDGMLSLGGPRT